MEAGRRPWAEGDRTDPHAPRRYGLPAVALVAKAGGQTTEDELENNPFF